MLLQGVGGGLLPVLAYATISSCGRDVLSARGRLRSSAWSVLAKGPHSGAARRVWWFSFETSLPASLEASVFPRPAPWAGAGRSSPPSAAFSNREGPIEKVEDKSRTVVPVLCQLTQSFTVCSGRNSRYG